MKLWPITRQVAAIRLHTLERMERVVTEPLEIEPVEDLPDAPAAHVPEREIEEVETRDMLDEEAAEGAEPYFPPTDPVVNDEPIGGFEATSMDEIAVDRSTLDDEPGDEALADAVRRELREDALTSQLRLAVEVKRGVAYVRGAAEDLEDTDNAAEVASRVPGVDRVVTDIALPET